MDTYVYKNKKLITTAEENWKSGWGEEVWVKTEGRNKKDV